VRVCSAFEGGFYEMRNVWQRIRGGENAREAVLGGMFGLWAVCRQVLPLIDYVGEQAVGQRPLELAGFDCQFSGGPSRASVTDGILQFVARQGIDATTIPEWSQFVVVLRKLEAGNVGEWKPTAQERDLALATLDQLIQRSLNTSDRDVAFWRQLFRSIKAQTLSRFE
jgi:hypothetical protein